MVFQELQEVSTKAAMGVMNLVVVVVVITAAAAAETMVPAAAVQAIGIRELLLVDIQPEVQRQLQEHL
jgi:hypothetical protein